MKPKKKFQGIRAKIPPSYAKYRESIVDPWQMNAPMISFLRGYERGQLALLYRMRGEIEALILALKLGAQNDSELR